jgi:hypothetical protein
MHGHARVAGVRSHERHRAGAVRHPRRKRVYHVREHGSVDVVRVVVLLLRHSVLRGARRHEHTRAGVQRAARLAVAAAVALAAAAGV